MPKNLGQPSKLDERISAPSGAMDKKLGAQSAPAKEYPQASFEQQLDAIDAQRKAIEARVQSKASIGDNLLKPEVLMKLGLAAAAAGFGGEAGQGLGLALGMGTLGGAQQQVDQSNMDRQKEIDTLTGMVDKQQQRLVTLMQTMPGAFVNDAGENISSHEEWLEVLPLGMPFDMSALTRRKAADGKNPLAQVASKLMDVGKSTEDPVVFRQGLEYYSQAHGLGWSSEYMDKMSYSLQPDKLLDVMMEEHTAESVTRLATTATKLGLSVYDPQLGGILVLKPQGAQPSTVKEQAYLDAENKLREWLKNDDHLALWEMNPYDALDQAFEGDPTSQAALQDGSAFFNRGTRADELRLRVEAEMWKDVTAIKIAAGGGYGQEGPKLDKLRADISANIDDTFNRGRDIVTLDKNKRTATSAGAAYVASRDLPKDKANTIGTGLVVRRNALMRQAGLEPNSTPNSIGDLFMAASIAYEDWLFGHADGSEEQYNEKLAKARAAAGN